MKMLMRRLMAAEMTTLVACIGASRGISYCGCHVDVILGCYTVVMSGGGNKRSAHVCAMRAAMCCYLGALHDGDISTGTSSTSDGSHVCLYPAAPLSR